MIKRTTLVEQFSTFIDFSSERWIIEYKLQQRMENYLLADSSLTSTEYWGLFFQQKWLAQGKKQDFFRSHLYAYLQEPCYYIAKEIEHNYYNKQFRYNCEDYFNLGVLEFDKILTDFKPGLNTRLYLFATIRLKWRILDRMREIDRTVGYTIWSLLLSSSPTRFKKALINQGISQDILANYNLVWNLYKEFYSRAQIKQNGKLDKPDIKTIEAITNAYNLKTQSKVDLMTIERWLISSGQAIFQFMSPPVSVPLEPLITSQGNFNEPTTEEKEQEYKKFLENQEIFARIYNWLTKELENIFEQTEKNKLHPEIKKILEYKYLEKLPQNQIGQKVNPALKQFEVSRQLDRFYLKLSKSLIQWSSANLESPLKAQDIENLSESVEQWIEYYYLKIKD
ncbi:MAG: hypothetical protein WCO81_12130 [Cyanobacteriota bacterium ELA615]